MNENHRNPEDLSRYNSPITRRDFIKTTFKTTAAAMLSLTMKHKKVFASPGSESPATESVSEWERKKQEAIKGTFSYNPETGKYDGLITFSEFKDLGIEWKPEELPEVNLDIVNQQLRKGNYGFELKCDWRHLLQAAHQRYEEILKDPNKTIIDPTKEQTDELVWLFSGFTGLPPDFIYTIGFRENVLRGNMPSLHGDETPPSGDGMFAPYVHESDGIPYWGKKIALKNQEIEIGHFKTETQSTTLPLPSKVIASDQYINMAFGLAIYVEHLSRLLVGNRLKGLKDYLEFKGTQLNSPQAALAGVSYSLYYHGPEPMQEYIRMFSNKEYTGSDGDNGGTKNELNELLDADYYLKKPVRLAAECFQNRPWNNPEFIVRGKTEESKDLKFYSPHLTPDEVAFYKNEFIVHEFEQKEADWLYRYLFTDDLLTEPDLNKKLYLTRKSLFASFSKKYSESPRGKLSDQAKRQLNNLLFETLKADIIPVQENERKLYLAVLMHCLDKSFILLTEISENKKSSDVLDYSYFQESYNLIKKAASFFEKFPGLNDFWEKIHRFGFVNYSNPDETPINELEYFLDNLSSEGSVDLGKFLTNIENAKAMLGDLLTGQERKIYLDIFSTLKHFFEDELKQIDFKRLSKNHKTLLCRILANYFHQVYNPWAFFIKDKVDFIYSLQLFHNNNGRINISHWDIQRRLWLSSQATSIAERFTQGKVLLAEMEGLTCYKFPPTPLEGKDLLETLPEVKINLSYLGNLKPEAAALVSRTKDQKDAFCEFHMFISALQVASRLKDNLPDSVSLIDDLSRKILEQISMFKIFLKEGLNNETAEKHQCGDGSEFHRARRTASFLTGKLMRLYLGPTPPQHLTLEYAWQLKQFYSEEDVNNNKTAVEAFLKDLDRLPPHLSPIHEMEQELLPFITSDEADEVTILHFIKHKLSNYPYGNPDLLNLIKQERKKKEGL